MSETALIMKKGIRKVRKQWIFLTKEFLILVSSSRTVLQNMALSTAIFSLQPAEYKPKPQCMVHTTYLQIPLYYCTLLLHYYFLFFNVGCTAIYSRQGSVQPYEKEKVEKANNGEKKVEGEKNKNQKLEKLEGKD